MIYDSWRVYWLKDFIAPSQHTAKSASVPAKDIKAAKEDQSCVYASQSSIAAFSNNLGGMHTFTIQALKFCTKLFSSATKEC